MMKFYVCLFGLFISSFTLLGQSSKEAYVEGMFGYGQHGSGDFLGYLYGATYGSELRNRLYLEVGLEGTTHDDEGFPLTVTDENGQEFDSTLHNVISGFQLTSGVKYNLVQNDNHRFGVSLMALGRYQATTLNGSMVTLYPAFTDLPYAVRLFLKREPARTFSFGGTVRLSYQYHISQKVYLGVSGGLQTDTHGDTLVYGMIRLGRFF